MDKVYVKEARTKRQMHDFVRFANGLYAACPYFVPDLEQDVRDTFNPKKNAGLAFSDIQPFVAYDRGGKPVGRIAGIINRKANEKWNTRSVRFAFIDFIDDVQVAAALLKAVEQWGRERGMEQIQGPLGITDFDKEGMLVEDFDQLGSMNTYYNYPYYPRHLEALGYEKEVDWVQIAVDVPRVLPQKFVRVAQFAKKTFGLQLKKLTNAEIAKGGYGQKIFALLNAAYAPLFGYTELSDKQVEQFVGQYLKLVDKQLLPVIENAEGELVGVAVTMGSLSHAIRKAKGRLFPFGWFHLLAALTWKHDDKVEMLLIAVRPDYQGRGVNALFFEDLFTVYNKYGFKTAETGPQLENNVKELAQWKLLNPRFVKRRRCYKKLL
ncbi:MAG: N-acetyltransferase [Prevotellaceae bacterium]|nr:N-acetyltransferase [Prevotellaceae bacterium]